MLCLNLVSYSQNKPIEINSESHINFGSNYPQVADDIVEFKNGKFANISMKLILSKDNNAEKICC